MIGLLHSMLGQWDVAYMIAWGYLATECRDIV